MPQTKRKVKKATQEGISNFDEIEQKLGIQQVLFDQLLLFLLNCHVLCNPKLPTKPEDWFTIKLTDVREVGVPPRVVKNIHQLVEVLQHKYPSHNWDKMYIMKGRFGQQRRLEHAIASLFPVYYSAPLSVPLS